MKAILEEYMGLVLVIVTVLIVIYLYKDAIFKSLTSATDSVSRAITGTDLSGLKADLNLIQDTSISDFAKNVIDSLAPTITQQDFRNNIALIKAGLPVRRIG